MKVLSLCFISFLIILKVFAIDFGDLKAVPDSVLNDVLKLGPSPINEIVGDTVFSEDINEYYLYTCKNPTEGQRLIYKDEKSISNSFFDKCQYTYFVIHGWTGDHENPLNQNVTNTVLSSCDTCNYNVIRVGWGKYAKSEYTFASAAVRKVGEYLCYFIKWLTTLGLLFSKTVLIGQSLGAHVAGFAGRICDCKIGRIIGTDPARPLWECNPEKLSKKDACYVEVTHSSDTLGDPSLIGHADYYANGGRKQPKSCDSLDFFCNHNMAPLYWSASWYYPKEYVAYQCASMDDVDQNQCNGKAVPYGGCNQSNKWEGIFEFNTDLPYYPYMEVE